MGQFYEIRRQNPGAASKLSGIRKEWHNGFQTLIDQTADSYLTQKPPVGQITLPIRNLGNTCFFNSIIQTLTHCTPLLNLCLRDSQHEEVC